MHPIKRGALIALFSFGAIAGFHHGMATVGSCHQSRRAAFEDHVAEVCTRAAQRVQSEGNVDRDEARRPDPRFIPYGAPQWGWGPPPPQWGPPPSAAYAPATPAPAAPAVAAPAPAAIPAADSPAAE